jgi:hypothetical protein
MRNLVQELRDSGYKVSCTHYRKYWQLDENRRPKQVLLAKYEGPGLKYAIETGGKTVVEITDEKSGRTLVGESVCGKDEQFNKRLAVKIALGRIMKHL